LTGATQDGGSQQVRLTDEQESLTWMGEAHSWRSPWSSCWFFGSLIGPNLVEILDARLSLGEITPR